MSTTIYKQKVKDIDVPIDIARKYNILTSFDPIKIPNPPNARKLGLKKAIETCYKDNKCSSCNQAYYITLNYIFNFDFDTFIDQLRYVQKY